MRYLIDLIPKNPYNRWGPKKLQDWYRSVGRTVDVAQRLMRGGHEVVVVITSNFNPLGEKWEIDVFKEEFNSTAPWLEVRTYKETNDTLGQVDRAFELAREMDAEVVFVSAWLQYPRVRYLVRGRESLHFGAFGIPHPVFAFADPIFMIIFPVLDLFGLGPWFQAAIVRRRECGKI